MMSLKVVNNIAQQMLTTETHERQILKVIDCVMSLLENISRLTEHDCIGVTPLLYILLRVTERDWLKYTL